MIGLEYILGLYNIPHTELAKELGIARQNINLWIKCKGKIPEKHLPKLSEKFRIPEEYFQKELTKEDELKIQGIKIDNEWEVIMKENDENHGLSEESENKLDKVFDLKNKLMQDETEQRLKKLLEMKEEYDKGALLRVSFLELVGDVIETRNEDVLTVAMMLLDLLLHYYKPNESKYNIGDTNDEENKCLNECNKEMSKKELEMLENIKEYFKLQGEYNKIIKEQ